MRGSTRRELLLMTSASATLPATGLPQAHAAARQRVPDGLIPLWPGSLPGDLFPSRLEKVVERAPAGMPADRAVTGISRPRLAVFRPAVSNGAAVLIMPGGGYQRIVMDREGYVVAEWLSQNGFAAFVLFSRLPAEGWMAPSTVALSDAQRAMRLIRGMAATERIDPERISALGFSAGGHLCADLAARFALRAYAPVDLLDSLSARPCCAAQIYPVVSMDPALAHPGSRTRLLGAAPGRAEAIALSPDRNVPANAPPHFLVHAEDDRVVSVENTLSLRAALRPRGIAVETHLFNRGGHGFGLGREAGDPVSNWPRLWLGWAQTGGLIS